MDPRHFSMTVTFCRDWIGVTFVQIDSCWIFRAATMEVCINISVIAWSKHSNPPPPNPCSRLIDMKFTTVLAFVFVFVAASVSATPFRETNGERMARGLPPLPPQKRSGTPVYGAFWEGRFHVNPWPICRIAAKRTGPSSSPGQCTTGPVQCCNSVGTADDSVIGLILGLLGIVLGDGVLAGVGCSPITVIGASSSSWFVLSLLFNFNYWPDYSSAQTVCCEDNSSSLISIGCIPSEFFLLSHATKSYQSF